MKPKMVEAGQPIKVGERSLTVLLEIESGNDKRVYKVKDEAGMFYVYKHAKRRTIKKEVERTEVLKTLNLAYAKVVSDGSDYIVRQWVQGTRGDEWLKSWESFGAPLEIEAVTDLFRILDVSAKAGFYIGKLDPEDMIFDGKKWTIIDCGGVRPVRSTDAARRYFWKFLERWGLKLDRHRNALLNLFTFLVPLGKDYPEVPVVSAAVINSDSSEIPNKKEDPKEDLSSEEIMDRDSSVDSFPPDSADSTDSLAPVASIVEDPNGIG